MGVRVCCYTDGGGVFFSGGDDVSGWWLFNEAVKQSTLQHACMDLGLGRQGSKPYLRRRFLASVGKPLDVMEEEQEEDEAERSDEDEPAAAVVEAAGAPMPAKKGRGRPRKQYSPADAGNGSSVCDGCQPGQSPRPARGRAARGSGGEGSSPWDAVECQRCGSTDREHKMILCDECDGIYIHTLFVCKCVYIHLGVGVYMCIYIYMYKQTCMCVCMIYIMIAGGYHYDTCAYPRLYAIPRGNLLHALKVSLAVCM